MANKELPKLQALLAASSSTARRDGLRGLVDASFIDSGLVVHGVAPDKDCGVYESDDSPPVEVALDKALVVAVSLGLVAPENVAGVIGQTFGLEEGDEKAERNWIDQVIRLNPRDYDLDDGYMVGIWASDVITLVRRNDQDQHQELLKLERKTEGKSPKKKKKIEKKDRKAMYELYTTTDFEVIFRVAIAYFENSGKTRVEQWDIKAEFAPVSRKKVKKAYKEGGTANYSGPRLDLAKMALKGQAKRLLVKRTDEEADESYRPIASELLHLLVRGGILYPHAFMQFINGEEIELDKME